MRAQSNPPIIAVAAALLTAALAVTGCSADGGDDEKSAGAGSAADRQVAPSGASGAVREGGGRPEGGAKTDGKPGRTGSTPVKIAPSQVIRTATLTVTAKDVPDALAKARTAVGSAGGYVSDETTDEDADGHERSRVTLKVPPDSYDDVLDELGGLGKHVERRVNAKDVTDQVVDVESRIKSQKASVARVRALMDKAGALSDVVSLESELSTREADLEALLAQRSSLKERTGMATVTLVLREPDAKAEPNGKDDDETSFGEALSGGWDAFTTTVRWIAVALGAVLPFAVAAALLLLLWRAVRSRLPERAPRTARAPHTPWSPPIDPAHSAPRAPRAGGLTPPEPVTVPGPLNAPEESGDEEAAPGNKDG
ncbi:DUF4349 domain-containing protein [Streptomyces sp. H27-D2]|uniref:DUF4349 domain-containing protein n=1 Tax=Streptomyces sp. H27-D2 TaxID=3046304 RepID=UPI002DBA5982|nr:DUF4349 domain-containing protein [Streptomyces sp. H27-D2]MEC4019966.1 DUF4349 domain-containing protein [Streptomyces sp. H27-D2]